MFFMSIAERVKNKIFREYTKYLSVDKLMRIAKRYIKKSGYLPIAVVYHQVAPTPNNDLTVSIKTMEENILFYKKYGFEFLYEEEFFKADAPAVILTFDDGYKDNYEYLFPLLKKHNVKASINLIGNKLVCENEPRYLNLDEIKEMADSGLVSFQSHAYTHRHLLECSRDELEKEIVKSKEVIEEKTGRKCSVLVTPYLQNSQQIIHIAKDHYDLIYSDNVNYEEYKYHIPRMGSGENITERRLAELICLKAWKNRKIKA